LSSTVLAEPVDDQDTGPGAPRPKVRLRYIIVPAITVLFLAVALMISWFSVAAYTSNHVRITASSTALRCGASHTRTVPDDADLGADVQIGLLSPALNCELHLQIRNGGTVPIRIDRVTYGGLGKGNLVAYVDSIDGWESKGNDVVGDAYGVPATTSLAPGATITVTARITAAKLTCVADGTTYFWGDNPVLNLSVLGLGSQRKASDFHFGFRGTKHSTDAGCQQ
jgi:hypothetical protein